MVISKMGLQVGLVVRQLQRILRPTAAESRTLPLLKQHQLMSMM